MDILTQGLLGASVAISGAKKEELKQALAIGFLSGLLADADVLIQSGSDALLTLEYHRHFTHALIFVPFGALIASALLWPFYRKTITFPVIYKYAFLGYLLSGVLDALTSYGTHLYWPFTSERVAWHLISIVDPVFTLSLLLGVIFSSLYKNKRFSGIALLVCLTYLSISYLQLQRVEQKIIDIATHRGHNITRLVVKPTMGNIILWRTIYLANGEFVVDAVHAGLLDTSLYPGNTAKHITPEMFPAIAQPGSILHKDIQRFNYFSDGFVAWHPERTDVLGDVRYALIPDSTWPLWGIQFNIEHPGQHVNFVSFRKADENTWSRFLNMVLAKKH